MNEQLHFDAPEPASDRLEALLDAEREPYGNRAPEIPVFLPNNTWVAPWVRLAQQHALPTFTTHQGAYAYIEKGV